jgi:hypothetical protein
VQLFSKRWVLEWRKRNSPLSDLFQRLSSPDMSSLEVIFDDGSALITRRDSRHSMSLMYTGEDLWADIMCFENGRVECEVRVKDDGVMFCGTTELYDAAREFAPTFFSWILWNLV